MGLMGDTRQELSLQSQKIPVQASWGTSSSRRIRCLQPVPKGFLKPKRTQDLGVRLSLQVQGKRMSYGPQGSAGGSWGWRGHEVIFWGGSLAEALPYLSSGGSDPLNLKA